jgi:CIC family chloride channel protein
MRLPSFSLRSDQFEYLQLIVLASATGMFAAIAHYLFNRLISGFSWLFLAVEWDALGIDRGWPWTLLTPIILLSGAVGMLLLNRIFPGDVFGYGFPDFLEMVNLGTARVKRRWIVVKAAGAALSLGSGVSTGREGPIAQIGGAIGSALAQMRKLSADRAKVLVAAGAGAGIATTFNAPIGGLMFAQEIVLLGHTEVANLTLLIVATMSAVVTSRAILGNAPVFGVPIFEMRSYWEMLSYAVMGVGLGLLSAGYIRFFHLTARTFRRMSAPQWTKLAVGLGLVGVIAIALPENLSDGYPVINEAMAGRFGFALLASLCAAKLVASSVSLACGAPGGVFGPTFFIGTMAGGAFQRICARIIPRLTGPRGSYALVGLGAFLTGTTHAPLTALFLLFEMTHSYEIALPAMVATIAAVAVARSLESESIDTYGLAREGKTLAVGRARLALAQIPVSAVMSADVRYVNDSTPMADVLRVAGDSPQSTLPVVNTEGRLAGIIVTRELLAAMSTGRELGPLVNAYDLCRPNCPTVGPDSTLDEASQAMEYEALDEVPVVSSPEENRFVGLVTRQHIAQALNRVAVSIASLAAPQTSIFWATGYRVTRIQIPAEADQVTVRSLDPRARFGVTVLAVQDASDPQSGFAPPDPDRKLRAGELIVVAGRPADLRRFVRALSGEQAAKGARAAE